MVIQQPYNRAGVRVSVYTIVGECRAERAEAGSQAGSPPGLGRASRGADTESGARQNSHGRKALAVFGIQQQDMEALARARRRIGGFMVGSIRHVNMLW